MGGNPKSKAISLSARVFFSFCFSVEILTKFMATTSGDGDLWNTTFSGATKTNVVPERKSSKAIGGVIPPKHHGYILQHAFCHI